ncbi:hypothetical protein [Kocuria sp.]|uniref:hypothetical protein n=1 Tax=Kocuria sp. TaxID=1871328 RepID=UPI0026E0E0A4|nr:hypothetical protein [Kocuria sp.]MDO5619300.1 hypothetical protein [Kocuria sp.]
MSADPYRPQPGERAVVHGSRTGSLSVEMSGKRRAFETVASLDHDGAAIIRPYLTDRPLTRDEHTWLWHTVRTAYERLLAGQSLADMATHQVVATSATRPYIAPLPKTPNPGHDQPELFPTGGDTP